MQDMEQIYQEYAQTVYKYLFSKTHDPDLAEELTQETFYQALKGIDRFDGSCKVSTWLCAIAKNQLSAYWRKYSKQENIEDTDIATESVEQDVLAGLARVELMKQLHSCPEPFREVMYLRIFGNLSFREIGEIMGKTENWARVTFYRGKEMLKKGLVEYE